MTQVVEHLPHRYKILNSNSSTEKEKKTQNQNTIYQYQYLWDVPKAVVRESL
jgi:hypothetical protein